MNTSFTLKPDERASFLGEPQLISARGPLTLMRIVGRTASGEANNPFGRYWFNENYFWSVIDFLTNHHKEVELVNYYLKLILRDGLAVCHDWNSFAMIYQLRIPAGAELHAYSGTARPQPPFSSSDHRFSSDWKRNQLAGGARQYVVNMDLVDRKHVNGPLPMGIAGIGHA